MKILGIIPARYASTRFPGKPLIDIGGKSMIRRVYEQTEKTSAITKVIVATDDERILNHVMDFGGNAMMTSNAHQSGTDRCAEVLQKEHSDWDVVVNIQGDEPYISPSQIDLVCRCFEDKTVQIATLSKIITNVAELDDANVVKVIFDVNKQAIYFSRFAIPYCRNWKDEARLKEHNFYKHIGIYAYTSSALREISKLKSSFLEVAESLEQLRWIENGYHIKVEITDEESFSIDSPEDLNKIKFWKL